MFGIFKIKIFLFAILLASPPVAAWIMRTESRTTQGIDNQSLSTKESTKASDEMVKVAVEVVAKGSNPQWVYVQVQNTAVPEPGSLTLAAVASLLLLRRRREPGK